MVVLEKYILVLVRSEGGVKGFLVRLLKSWFGVSVVDVVVSGAEDSRPRETKNHDDIYNSRRGKRTLSVLAP